MTAKLTLELEEDAIERGKVYARNRKVSLSRMVETYFLGLNDRDEIQAPGPTGVVAELAGILGRQRCRSLRRGASALLGPKVLVTRIFVEAECVHLIERE